MTIVEDIEKFISRFMVIPEPEKLRVLSLWIIHTWTFSGEINASRTSGFLYINSPDKRSGKSHLLEVLELLVCNPMRSTNVTSSVLFRAIDKFQPTLLLDEVDAIFAGRSNEELRGILNGGYKEGGHIWRMQKGEPTAFNTFCPKVIAGINNGYLPDTIADRSIPITLRRKDPSVEVEEFYSLELKDEVEPLIDRIAIWVADNAKKLRSHKPKKIAHASDRQWEIAQPLVAIGELLKAKGSREAIGEVLKEKIERTTEPPRVQLLGMIKSIFDLKGAKVFSGEVLEAMGDKGWTSKSIAKVLSDYDIETKNVRIGNEVRKGYYLADFEEVFARTL